MFRIEESESAKEDLEARRNPRQEGEDKALSLSHKSSISKETDNNSKDHRGEEEGGEGGEGGGDEEMDSRSPSSSTSSSAPHD